MPQPSIGIIGLGFMGRTHLAAYRAAGANVAAVLDPLAGKGPAGGNLSTGADAVDLSGIQVFTDAPSFFDRAPVDAVSICTPTDTHIAMAQQALAKGWDVLVEKPVALAADDIRRLQAAADQAARLCMPAMVMRFWPGWAWLKDRVDQRTFGPVESITLQRLGSGPSWNADFYRDFSRSGGALVDLHIHDADFLYWLFGCPASVAAVGTLERATTLYRYAAGPKRASAEGGWMTPPFAFLMRYIVQFERATAVFDLAGGETPVTVYADGKADKPALPTESGYHAEVRDFLRAVDARRAGRPPALRATLADAAAVADILAAERRSLEQARELLLEPSR